jgi:hypothetical protein
MTADKYDLDDIIRKSHEEFKEYLKKTGIEIKDIRLRILESLDLLKELHDMVKKSNIKKLKKELNTIDKSLFEKIYNEDIYIINKENLREFYIGEIYLLKQIYNTDNIMELNNKILEYVVNRIEKDYLGIGVPETREIYIIKDQVEKGIDETLNRLGTININGPSIIKLRSPLFGVASAPLYTEGKNIKEDVVKAVAANVIIHEAEHFMFGIGELANTELSVSALQYVTYIDMYNLLKYPKTYEIIKENIIECKKYFWRLAITDYYAFMGDLPKSLLKDFINVLKRASYDLGYCYASIIIDRNKNLNIKDIVEEVKKLSTLDALIKITY